MSILKKLKRKSTIKNIESTDRVESFSDGIFGFNLTLLVVELSVPMLSDKSHQTLLNALMNLGPKFFSFFISFLTIAIFWVNHHHFFHNFHRADWKLLWHNNALLFCITFIPFMTDFIGDYPTNDGVVMMYAIALLCTTLSFMMMIRYVFFKSNLMDGHIAIMDRKSEFKRIWPAIFLYAAAAIIAMLNVYVALGLLILTPLIYFIPSILEANENQHHGD